jgi:glycosyltransferase involved in cell wall biosynthesis
VQERLEQFDPQAVHIATEGPLGWKARAYCIKVGWPFTTAFHTRFAEIVNAAIKLPVSWGYAVLQHFHKPSTRVLVPAPATLRLLQQRGFPNAAQWNHGVDRDIFYPQQVDVLGLPRPIHLFVGRVSYEKNIEAFLQLDLPGSKVVCGVGPLLDRLKSRYPNVTWLPIMDRPSLAKVYCSADLFVFPSRADTFGLVILEAMACGTPVAAYPVEGPLDVIGDSDAGVMHEDLGVACSRAIQIDRAAPLRRAEQFDWSQVTDQFLELLAPIPRLLEPAFPALARLP